MGYSWEFSGCLAVLVGFAKLFLEFSRWFNPEKWGSNKKTPWLMWLHHRRHMQVMMVLMLNHSKPSIFWGDDVYPSPFIFPFMMVDTTIIWIHGNRWPFDELYLFSLVVIHVIMLRLVKWWFIGERFAACAADSLGDLQKKKQRFVARILLQRWIFGLFPTKS